MIMKDDDDIRKGSGNVEGEKIGEEEEEKRENCNETDGGKERAVRRRRRYKAKWDYEIGGIKGKV